MSSRIFVGIKADDDLIELVRAWRLDFERLPVRWIADRNLHFTLVAPWKEENVAVAGRRLAEFSGLFGQTHAHLQLVEFGPVKKEPRLIWAKGKSSPTLEQLYREAHKVLGQSLPKRPFRPHLSLARFKPADYQDFPVKVIHAQVDWPVKIDSICLYKVHLKPAGAEYEVFKKIII